MTNLRRPMARIGPLYAALAVFGLVNLATALGLLIVPEDGPDPEFPSVERRVYNPFPPRAYRWAEPGDTLDKIGIYAASAGLVTATLGWWRSYRRGSVGRWPVAWAGFAAAWWQACTPWPTPDGWHGLNWRVVFEPSAPVALRLALAGVALALGACAVGSTWATRGAFHRDGPIVWVALGLTVRFVPAPIPGPPGYWPRWCFAWGLMILTILAIRRLPPAELARPRSLGLILSVMAGIGLCLGGRWLIWYQRPIDRLRTVVPGRIYLSAMPTYRGLELAHNRHRFKTIINVFNEHGPLRSPRLPEELRFVRQYGLRYLGSPGDPLHADAFLDETLRLAQDPDAWPILVHCHGCMDRSPAWMGIYRFLVEGRPMVEVLREIEAHRGLRPKASVTLLYNRVLPERAPERYAADPVARELIEFAHGTPDPFLAELDRARRGVNLAPLRRVGQRDRPEHRRP